MTNPPFFWRGADAVADFTEWQTREQEKTDAALIVAATCPVIEDDGE